jgi:hypothetical protein
MEGSADPTDWKSKNVREQWPPGEPEVQACGIAGSGWCCFGRFDVVWRDHSVLAELPMAMRLVCR